MAEHVHVCATTGGSGYLGSRLKRHFEQRGWAVIELGRRPGNVPFTLGESVNPGDFASRDVSALIHCAYDFSVRTSLDNDRVNVAGTRRLFEAAKAGGVTRFVFISTMSAYTGCRSEYGRTKLECEKIAAEFGAVILRPGLIYGEKLGGMVGAMAGLIKKLPILPLIGSGRTMLYLTQEDDLSKLIEAALVRPETVPTGVPITAASEKGFEFREILRNLARQMDRHIWFIPVPWQLIWGVFRFAELFGLRLRLRSDGVLGLVFADPNPDFSQTRNLDVSFRTYP